MGASFWSACTFLLGFKSAFNIDLAPIAANPDLQLMVACRVALDGLMVKVI
jgi:hypothetical protein